MAEEPMVQSQAELEQFHSAVDPWGYEQNEHDRRRKAVLLSELPRRSYKFVVDIGCGQGFVSRDLPGDRVLGIDISEQAVSHAQQFANERLSFAQGSLFDLPRTVASSGVASSGVASSGVASGGLEWSGVRPDLLVITGVLYPQYIGEAKALVYELVDQVLAPGGILVSVHISSWSSSRFPYLMLKNTFYDYREYTHSLEVYVK